MQRYNNIWQISSCAFAVESKYSNIGNSEFKYKGIITNILKKTIIDLFENPSFGHSPNKVLSQVRIFSG